MDEMCGKSTNFFPPYQTISLQIINKNPSAPHKTPLSTPIFPNFPLSPYRLDTTSADSPSSSVPTKRKKLRRYYTTAADR